MPPPTPTLLGHLRRLIAPSVSDAALLTRWRDRRDEAAFAALMARHGPMVLGVCRRVLGDAQHAEDAFQAVFLVLARKAASVRRPEALPGFLYGVALRLARKARRRFVPTRSDMPEPVDPHPHPLDALTGRELLALLDEEIARLPEVFRLPLLLCVMQGRSVEEAARMLGWGHGSVRGRLARGRERLRERLTRRGLSVSVGGLALLAPIAVPDRLFAETLRHLAAPAPAVSALAAGSMPIIKLKTICLGLAVLAAVGLGAGLLFAPAPQPPAPATSPAPASVQAKNEPRRDRYGDPMPRGAVARLGTLRFRAPGEIQSLAFAPDGKTIAVAAYGELFLMDAASGKRIKRFPTVGGGPNWGMAGTENSLAFAPDGKRLLSRGHKAVNHYLYHVVRVWERDGEEKPREYDVGHHLAWVGWSAEGQPLAILIEKGVLHLHELAAGRSRRFACKDPQNYQTEVLNNDPRMDYSPRGQVLALVDNKSAIHVWNTVTGRECCTLQPKGIALSVAFSPDGSRLVSGTPQAVQMWDVATGKLLYTVDSKQRYESPLFSPDGKTLAVLDSWQTFCFWDAATGREYGRTQGKSSFASFFAFSPDGKELLTTPRHSSAVELWSVPDGVRKSMPAGHACRPHGTTFAPGGRRVATCGSMDGSIRIWDLATGEPLVHIDRGGWVRDCAFSADGRKLFANWTSDHFSIYDAATGERRQVVKLEDPERPDTVQSGLSLHLSDDGKTLVVLSSYYPKKNGAFLPHQETLITGWDTATCKQLFRRSRIGMDSWPALSADMRVLATRHPDMDVKERARAEIRGTHPKNAVRLEDMATGETRLMFPDVEGGISPTVFSPDGRTLATYQYVTKPSGKEGDATTTTTRSLRLWETATAAEVLTLPTEDFIRTAFSPDGRLVAVNASTKEILVYDLARGCERRRFKGLDAEVVSLSFTPDSRRLISGLGDSTLLVWDVTSDEVPRTGKLGGEAVARAWADLAGSDAPRAFWARWTLATAPEEALPMLKEHMHPAKPADPQRLRRMLDDLASDQFAVREKAQAELEEIGDLAEPALRQALENKPTLEVRRRILAVLERLRGPVTKPEILRSLRAVAVLEDIGTPLARRLLEELSQGTPEARVTREAGASLRRLERRSSAR